MAIIDRLIGSSIGWVPKPIVRKIATRYVAGESLDSALVVAKDLNRQGCMVTFDVLGEFIRQSEEADHTAAEYGDVLKAISAHGIDGNISIKLTAFGLLLDEAATYARVRSLVEAARDLGHFVRIDMEGSPCTDRTLAVLRRLREAGLSNVGVVVQAYLKRTMQDLATLADLRSSYRLCKGIYVESPDIAYKDAQEIRNNYLACLERMLDGGSYVGIATHDPWLVEKCAEILKKRGTPPMHYEFQMLLGVAEGLRSEIVRGGHRLRVYVPFGRDWYGYCVRRLKENPKIGRYVLAGMFRRN